LAQKHDKKVIYISGVSELFVLDIAEVITVAPTTTAG